MSKVEKPKVEIKEMPDKETLERYVGGMFGEPKVIFDLDKGKFIDTQKPVRGLTVRGSKNG